MEAEPGPAVCPSHLYPSGPPLWITPLWNGPTDAMEGVVRSYSASWSYGSTNSGLRVHKLPLKSYGGKPRHSIMVGKPYGGKPRPDSRHSVWPTPYGSGVGASTLCGRHHTALELVSVWGGLNLNALHPEFFRIPSGPMSLGTAYYTGANSTS
jgi:hypothetical protein